MNYWRDRNLETPFTQGGEDAHAERLAKQWEEDRQRRVRSQAPAGSARRGGQPGRRRSNKKFWIASLLLLVGTAVALWMKLGAAPSYGLKRVAPSARAAAPAGSPRAMIAEMVAEGREIYDVRLGMSGAEVQRALKGQMDWTVRIEGRPGPDFAGIISATGRGGGVVVRFLDDQALLVTMVASSVPERGRRATEREYVETFRAAFGTPTSDVYAAKDLRRITWVSGPSNSTCGLELGVAGVTSLSTPKRAEVLERRGHAGVVALELSPVAASIDEPLRCGNVLMHTLALRGGFVTEVTGALGNAGAIAIALGGAHTP